jgi:oligopeptide transport system substrate-binding protein
MQERKVRRLEDPFAWLAAFAALALCGCAERPWNDPNIEFDPAGSTLFQTFSERPKHLDPLSAYSEDEAVFVAQIYEPPLQYAFLERPFRLEPLTLASMPEVRYEAADGTLLPPDAAPEAIAFTRYRFALKPGILFQPHPAFSRDADGGLLHHDLAPGVVASLASPWGLPSPGTRELVSADYVYQVKRLAHPRLHSPVQGLMANYIVGLGELADRLRAEHPEDTYIDLRGYSLDGARAIDDHHFEILIRGVYPQFLYWLAMPFFAPMPWEAEAFHAQSGMQERNLTLDWWPVGTGPYMLLENNPNRRMVLARNPNFRGEPFPARIAPELASGELKEAEGKSMPFIDRAVFVLEKEAIPTWHKFLQGYYDIAGIPRDSFEQVVSYGVDGSAALSAELTEHGVELLTAVEPSSIYLGFNMRDPLVGGLDERARKLRQAIAIALDTEEFISIFRNGRGTPAFGPIPPGIEGHSEGVGGINPVTHRVVDGRIQRRPIEDALTLMREAGYGDGIDPATGRALVLGFDTVAGGPDSQPVLDWHRKKLARIGIDLVIRATDYNRFQEKMRTGNAQIFQWGWNADYPDPENFLFLLHGPQSKVDGGGENAANYANPEFDALFERFRVMQPSPERAALVARMVELVRTDSPWVWGWHPVSYSLHHAWFRHAVPHPVARNSLKYRDIDGPVRTSSQRAWNQPRLWPVLAALAVLAVLAFWLARRRAAPPANAIRPVDGQRA